MSVHSFSRSLLRATTKSTAASHTSLLQPSVRQLASSASPRVKTFEIYRWVKRESESEQVVAYLLG